MPGQNTQELINAFTFGHGCLDMKFVVIPPELIVVMPLTVALAVLAFQRIRQRLESVTYSFLFVKNRAPVGLNL